MENWTLNGTSGSNSVNTLYYRWIWYTFSTAEPVTNFIIDWPNRSTEIGGPDTMWAYPYNFFGDIPYENITLDYQLVYGELGTTLSVSEVMDLEAGALCYTYE